MAEELFGVSVDPTPQTELFGVAAEDDPESEQTVIGSIARGAGAGVVDIAQGIAELGASGLTAAGVLEGKEQEATAAVEALCLDFGAVDVVWNATKNKAFVLEVNTAPGVEGTTLEEYKEYFENVLINSELPLTNVVKDNPIRR